MLFQDNQILLKKNYQFNKQSLFFELFECYQNYCQIYNQVAFIKLIYKRNKIYCWKIHHQHKDKHLTLKIFLQHLIVKFQPNLFQSAIQLIILPTQQYSLLQGKIQRLSVNQLKRMQNSAINKSTKNTNTGLKDTMMTNAKVQSESQNQQQKNVFDKIFQKMNLQVDQKSQKVPFELFKRFRQSAQPKQHPPIEETSKTSIRINNHSSSQNNVTSSLFSRFKKQQTYAQPNSSNKFSQQQNNIKLTNPATIVSEFQNNNNKFLNDQQLYAHSLKSIDSPQRVNNKHAVKDYQHNLLQFGEGLERIQEEQKALISKHIHDNNNNNKGTKTFTTQNQLPSQFSQIPSAFTQVQSSISTSKKHPQRISDAQMRSTVKSFFKRSSSLTNSQDYLKTLASDMHKADNKKDLGGNGPNSTTISPFRELIDHRTTKQTNTRPSSQGKRPSSKTPPTLISPLLTNTFHHLNRNQINLSLANNLSRILFKYNGGHATTLYNYGVKLKNQSPIRLSLKVKCTNPRNYQLRPCSDAILNPGQIFTLSIELKLFPHDLNHTTVKHDLTRYHSDKFKIIYWTPDHLTEEEYFEGEKVLPVVIQQTEEEKIRNQCMAKNINNQKIKLASEEKEIQMYKKLIEKSKVRTEQVQEKIRLLAVKQFNHQYFSKHVFLFAALIGSVIGFWIT